MDGVGLPLSILLRLRLLTQSRPRPQLTAIRKIREMESSRELPSVSRVIALTGNARSGQIEEYVVLFP